MSIRDTQAWSVMIVAYATQCQVQKAISMFRETMSDVCGIIPGIEHYWCVVDLLG